MTPALLKQARETLWDVAQELHHIDSGPIKELGGLIAKVEDAAAALTAFDSLSDYDKAIHAIAPYLPDGWVAQDESGWTYLHLHGEPKAYARNGDGDGCWAAELDDFLDIVSCLNIPKHPDWRKSLRRITHNSDGTVTVERG